MISRGKRKWLLNEYQYLCNLKNPALAPFAERIRNVSPKRIRDMQEVIVTALRKAASDLINGATYDEAIKAATSPYPNILGEASRNRARRHSAG